MNSSLELRTLLRLTAPHPRTALIVQRIYQSTRQLEPRNLHLAVNAGDQHHHPRVRLLEVKEQHDAASGAGIAMDKPVRAQIGDECAFQSHGSSDCFRDHISKN